jgi:hypothetical protein
VGCSDGFVDEIQVPEAVSEDQWEIVNTTRRSHWWMFGVQWGLEGLQPCWIPTRPTTQVGITLVFLVGCYITEDVIPTAFLGGWVLD